MDQNYLKEISDSLKILVQQPGKPFYFTQEFWTAAATIVAIFLPLFVIWLSNRPKRSRVVIEGVSVLNQDPANDEFQKNLTRLTDVGRVIIKNHGKYKASSVEAYIENIIYEGENRKDFFPIPLFWTHGQLNKNGPTIRDIYPNQTVYLDIFNYIYDDGYVGNGIVAFAVAAGNNVENLSRVNLGESKILIKTYQESGQVDSINLKINWDGKSVPKLSII